MSFAVVHMQKFKTSGVKGIQFHNQRERESKTNPDIDKTKAHLNYDLHNDKNIDYNKRVKEIISDNVVTNRAIRKDAVVMCNFVVTSDKKFFDGLTDLEQRKFFEKSYEFFKDRYGEKNIVAANVHLDERTPHLHLSLVPVTADEKLSAKRLFDRKELRAIQDDFPKFIQGYGFSLERGIDAEGKNKHIETQKFKAMEVGSKVKELEHQKNTLQSDLNALQGDLVKLEGVQANFKQIDAIEGKKSLLGSKVTINQHDFDVLKSIAKRQVIKEREFKQSESKIFDLEKENRELRSFVSKFQEKKLGVKEKLKKIELEDKLTQYEKAFSNLTGYLKATNQYEKAKSFIQERQISKIKNMDLEI